MPTGDAKVAAMRPAADRVLDRCVEEGQCWIWTGTRRGREPHQYGQVQCGSRRDGDRRTRSTHVVVYEALIGDVPEGLELDHLCRRKLCCNPWHLEPVTHRVNAQRMEISMEERQRRSEHMRRVNERRWSA